MNDVIENKKASVYARLYTKNGTNEEILILANKEESFEDYTQELTLKEDFKDINNKRYTKEDLYKIPEYAEGFNSEEWKQYEKENPEEAKQTIETTLLELNANVHRPWIRCEDNGFGDWYYKNDNLSEVRILNEILPSVIEGWFERCES